LSPAGQLACSTRSDRSNWLHKTLGRSRPWQEHAVSFCRLAAAISLQPPGGLRRPLTGSGGGAWGHSIIFGSDVPAHEGIYSYGASLSQPLFEGGYLRNNLRYAKFQDRQALISYRQTIQRAFGDVSDALIGYDKYHGVRERQEQTVRDLQESVSVSLTRYRGGTATYLDVLDSQRSLFDAELTLAQARNNEYQSLVQLYKALGGGWK